MSAGVPSSPRNVISVVNETSVILEWHPPRETGGRGDVVYNIVCKKCRADRRACSHCDDNVDFVPRQLGLTESRVLISNLLAHTLYSFEIQAVNGVSNKSPYPAQHVSIDITTNQAGEWRLLGGGGWGVRLGSNIISLMSARPGDGVWHFGSFYHPIFLWIQFGQVRLKVIFPSPSFLLPPRPLPFPPPHYRLFACTRPWPLT